MKKLVAIVAAAFVSVTGAANAQVLKIGVTMGATGAGASLGVHYKNAFQLMPSTVGGVPAQFIILEDNTDPSVAAKNARKLITEDMVDVVMGSVSVPSTTQMALIANETKTPMIALSPVALPPEKLEWVFPIPQPVPLMMSAVVEHMTKAGVKTIGYIGYSDSFGDLVLKSLQKYSDPAGMKVLLDERYARADTSVTGQIIKILAANPDAVVVGGSGTAAALPQIALIERGYKGQIYHNHGTANLEFIKVAAKSAEGAIAPTGALLVFEDLPADNPIKAVAADFVTRYEKMFGPGSRNGFAGYSYDGFLVLNAAVAAAVKKAQPGTPEFRKALRDALEGVKDVAGTHGIYSTTPTDHTGVDKRARVLVQVKDGRWRLMP